MPDADTVPRSALVAVGWVCKGRLFLTWCCDKAERVYVVRADDEAQPIAPC